MKYWDGLQAVAAILLDYLRHGQSGIMRVTDIMNTKTIARWAVLIPLFIIPFLALYIASDMYFPFITGKNFAFRALVEIALMGYIVLAIADRRYRPQFSWVLTSFALLVAWSLIADLFSINPHKAIWSNFERMDGWIMLVHVFALFLVAGPVLSIDRLWRNWWMTFIGATSLVTLHAVMQYFCIGNPCGVSGRFFSVHQSATRLDATLGNAEYLAGFLLLAIGITLWQAFESKGKGLRNTLLVLAVLELVVMIGTLTRGTMVAFVAASILGALMWMFMASERSESGTARNRRVGGAVLAVILVLVAGLFALRNSNFVQQNESLERFASVFSLREALGTRTTIWGIALEGAAERPIMGWGHEGFNYVFNMHYKPSLYGQEQWFDRAHDIYLDWLISGGIPALLLFLLLGASSIMAVYRSRDLKPWERVLILTTIIAYAIQGLAVFDNLFTYVPLAMLLAYAHTLRSRPIPAIERAPEVRGVSLDAGIAPAGAVIALLLMYFVNVPTIAAGKDLIKGLTPSSQVETRMGYFKSALARNPFATQEIREQLLTFSGQVITSSANPSIKAEAFSLASSEMQKEIDRAPQDARLHAFDASFLRAADRFDEARAAGAKAREFSPNKPSIIVEQGITEWQAGKPADARAFFDEAYALVPSSDDLAVYAAAGHIISKDVPGGKAILQAHFGTTVVNQMVLALAYQKVNDWNDAIAVLSAMYKQEENATTGYQLAIAYGRAGRFNEARVLTRAVMQAHPETSQQGASLLVKLGGS